MNKRPDEILNEIIENLEKSRKALAEIADQRIASQPLVDDANKKFLDVAKDVKELLEIWRKKQK